MPKAFSYLRFSTPEQMKGDSYRRQVRMAESYAEKHGLDLDRELTFEDRGVSGWRGKNSEAGRLGDFLEAVEVGLVPRGSTLLVEGLDRISRLTPRRAIRVLEDIVDSGVTLVTLSDGREYDKETLDRDHVSLLIAILTFMRANEESETKAARLRASWEHKRKEIADRPLTAKAPAWLSLKRDRSGFVVDEKRAEVVRRIFSMYLQGMGPNTIERTLNAEQIPVFGRGARWHRSYILKILDNPATIGTFTPHRITYKTGLRRREPLEAEPNYFPAIVEKDVFDRVRALRGSSGKPRGRHASSPLSNVLSGLARCPLCGGTVTLSVKNKSRGWVYLICATAKAKAGCKYHSVRYRRVETAIKKNATALLEDCPPSESADHLSGELAGTEEIISELSASAQRLVDELSIKPSSRLRQRLDELEEEISIADRRRQELQGMIDQSSGPLVASRVETAKTALLGGGFDKQTANQSLRELFRKVIVDYEAGVLRFSWHHSEQVTEVPFMWPEGRSG